MTTDNEKPVAEFTERQRAYMAYPHYAVLATISSDGTPQLSTVWFILENDQIVIVIEKDSLKARQLKRDPRVAVSIPNGGRYVAVKGRAEFDENQDSDEAQADLVRIGHRYYGPIEGMNQVRSFGDKPRMTVRIVPEKITSVGL
jgi:PPOX class probable F420-dependent enzyme